MGKQRWQDYVIAIIQWVFVIALVPTILNPVEKPTLASSIVTSTSLFVMAATLATLRLKVSAISTSAGAIAWAILAYQRYAYNREHGLPLFNLYDTLSNYWHQSGLAVWLSGLG